MICCYQNKKAILICFLQEGVTTKMIYTTYLKAILISLKLLLVEFLLFLLYSNKLRDIILLFHDIAGLDMNWEDWKKFCRKAWETDYEYLHIDRLVKIRECRYTIRNCNKTTFFRLHPWVTTFLNFYIYLNFATKNKDEFRDLDELEDLQSKVKQGKLVQKKLGKQGFH